MDKLKADTVKESGPKGPLHSPNRTMGDSDRWNDAIGDFSQGDLRRFIVNLLQSDPGAIPSSARGAEAFDPSSLLPSGSVTLFGGGTAPAGWLLCDGAAVSRSTYNQLFAAIGTAFGVGDGSTTFNLPDLRDRVPVGKSGTKALGATGGAATHTLSTAEMPAHTHGGYAFVNQQPTTLGGNTLSKYGEQTSIGDQAVGSTGGGGSHNNMQPYQALNYMIRT